MRQCLLIVLLLAATTSLEAQTGYSPSRSPFHELERGTFVEAMGGRVFGGGGSLLLGPRNGYSTGARFIVRAKNTLQFSFGAWTGGTERTVIDANDSIATRNKGLFKQRLIAGEIGFQLNLTGGKSWHHLAPFAALSFGLVNGQKSPAIDTSGYKFGTKIFFTPSLGTRLFIGRRIYLNAEARALFWKLNYPPSYRNEPAKQPGTAKQSNAVNLTGVSGQYTATPELRFGLGISW